MFLTNDAATIVRELEVIHPAAKLVVMASQQQENEVHYDDDATCANLKFQLGDATNLVLVFAGELLRKAEDLLHLGLHTAEITQGYEMALEYALKEMEGKTWMEGGSHTAAEHLAIGSVKSLRDKSELARAVRSSIAAKQFGYEDKLSDLVADAVLAVLPTKLDAFNVDSVRVVKVMGSNIEESRVVKGMVFPRESENTVKQVRHAKVGVYTCPIDISQTETKGTVLLHSAQEMLDFTKGEEKQLETAVKELYDSGLRVVVGGSSFGELALHYLDRYGIMAVKVPSKFDLRRLCRVVGATPLARLGAPMPEEMGSIDVVETVEIGGDRVTTFRQETEQTRTSTIVLRGGTQSHLDDVERAIDDGVNAVKALIKDDRLVAGAGACEMELIKRITEYASRTPGLSQHAIQAFGEAFEVVPKTLAENAGLDSTEVLSRLYAAHQQSDGKNVGVDVEDNNGTGTHDSVKAGILDILSAKYWALKTAGDAALTILKIDQVVMAKPAGGPKPPGAGARPNWDDDD